jgi:MEDS: MEthanogen/methylotroph, DcmR Sensory domain
MAHSNKQVTLARSAVDRRCRVCAFFHSREDEYKIMLPFLKEGREADEKFFRSWISASARSAWEQRSGVTRLWANMEWALEDFPGVHDVVEYESRINYMLPKYDMATVCT